MTIERGLIYGGAVLPGTEWCTRDTGAMWRLGERGTRTRDGLPHLLCGHWTAGPTRDGPSAGRSVYRAMRARQRPDGSPLDVGIHLVIGWDGLVHQLADLAIATVHVGSAGVNRRSIGVECCWPGTVAQAERLGVSGPSSRPRVAGRLAHVLLPSPEMLAAWVRLAETLATHLPVPRQVPLDRDGAILRDRMTPRALAAWSGAIEHLHVPGTTKIDAAGYLVGALRDAGWRGVTV